MCVPVTTILLQPILYYTVRQPTPIPFFPLPISVPPTPSSSFPIFLFPLVRPFPSYPSSCLWQPYKPWSSAAASSFTRAMYPDVSEGRNFASVCVLLFSFSLSLLCLLSLPSLPAPPLLSSLPLSSDFPVLARSSCESESARERVADACAQYVCMYVRVQRRYTCVISGHTYERKFGLSRMLGGYVSERYPPIKVFPINRRRNGGGYLSFCPWTSVSLFGLPAETSIV